MKVIYEKNQSKHCIEIIINIHIIIITLIIYTYRTSIFFKKKTQIILKIIALASDTFLRSLKQFVNFNVLTPQTNNRAILMFSYKLSTTCE